MLVLNPPKISWPLGLVVASGLFFGLQYPNVQNATPEGALKQVQGRLSYFDTKKYVFPNLVGEWGVARCYSIRCSDRAWVDREGQLATAVIDARGEIFDLRLPGEVLISKAQVDDYRNRTINYMGLSAVLMLVGAFWTWRVWSAGRSRRPAE